jgi:2-amino-4-hydroxy-6-hydroxymethyldihydropteridine diphosphokinase
MILIGMGANLPGPFGAPEQALAAAKTALVYGGMDIVAASRVWLTAPVPASDQPWFRNAVLAVRTDLTPAALLKRLHDIERDFGRVRTVRNAARVIDLDLLAYGDCVLAGQGDDLILPHPRMHRRGFVLLPLRDIAPAWVHPRLNVTLDDLLKSLPEDQLATPAEEARHAV